MANLYLEDYKAIVMSYLAEEPNIWTAKLCRLMNEVPETVEGIRFCGHCIDYANQRKRKRAACMPMLLPGMEEGAYLLHGPCRFMQLRLLQSILRSLENNQIVFSKPMTVIPDPVGTRGWDYATTWEFIE